MQHLLECHMFGIIHEQRQKTVGIRFQKYVFGKKKCFEAVSYNNKLILKTENGGFSTFRRISPGERGRIGAALLKVRLAFVLRDATNDVCRFFERGV